MLTLSAYFASNVNRDLKHNGGGRPADVASNVNRDLKHNVGQVSNGNRRGTGVKRESTWDRCQTGIDVDRCQTGIDVGQGALGHTGLQTGPETQRGTNRHLMQTWIQRGTLKTTGGIKTGEK
ncbi:hypothetical protein TNCV_3800181 [Trichonephila clavipes]|nr:hypothetical protein TNCV_3800181 [Trichonephila clavipes]